MLLVFRRSGPGSYRSRERRGVLFQNETYLILQQSTADSLELESAFSEQPRSLENTRQALPACRRGDILYI